MIKDSEFTGASRRTAQISLGLLVLVNVMSQLDRQIMSVLVESIRIDLDQFTRGEDRVLRRAVPVDEHEAGILFLDA